MFAMCREHATITDIPWVEDQLQRQLTL